MTLYEFHDLTSLVDHFRSGRICRIDSGVETGQNDRRHARSNRQVTRTELLSKALVAIQKRGQVSHLSPSPLLVAQGAS